MSDPIATYVAALRRHLAFDADLAHRACTEVEDHLREAAAAQAGAPGESAARRAVERFGAPQDIAADFARAGLPQRLHAAWLAAAFAAVAVFLTMRLRAVVLGYDIRDEAGTALLAFVDRYAFIAAIVVGVGGWLLARRPLARARIGSTSTPLALSAGGLTLSCGAGLVLSSLALRQLGWTPAAIVPVCSTAVEVAVLAFAAAHVRSVSRYARSALAQAHS